jgi:hypothetical protein
MKQHTGVWRYFSRMRLLGKPFPRGKARALRLVLHHRLRDKLTAAGNRSAPKAPPGVFRTPWGWRRVRATWAG